MTVTVGTEAALQSWLHAVVAAADDVCAAMDCDALEVVTPADDAPETASPSGAYIALVGDDVNLQVGLTSDATGCQTLAKALFGLKPDAANLPEADVADAVGEIVNMIGGGAKGAMSTG